MPVGHQELFNRIRVVVHRWDPYDLLRGGAPPDEFDGEIRRLVAQVPRIRSETDAAHAVSRVFSDSFQPTGFTPEDCAAVGRELFSVLAQGRIG